MTSSIREGVYLMLKRNCFYLRMENIFESQIWAARLSIFTKKRIIPRSTPEVRVVVVVSTVVLELQNFARLSRCGKILFALAYRIRNGFRHLQFRTFRNHGQNFSAYPSPINNKIRPWECNEDFKIFGNQTIQFNKGVLGYILYRKKVKGKTWGLVLIMPNDKHKQTSFVEQRFEQGKTYSLGWTKINENIQLAEK
jgi:hypothetical protein